MLDFLIKQKTNTLIYIFFSPWILFFISPMVHTPLENNQKAIILLFIILFIQGCLFFYWTFIVGNRLILIKERKFISKANKIYFIHCILNCLLFSMAMLISIIAVLVPISEEIILPIFLIGIFSEIFRAKYFSKLLVSMELDRKVGVKDYIWTIFLAMNPIIGVWNIHSRVVKLISKSLLSGC